MSVIGEFIFFVYLCGMTVWLVWWFVGWFKDVSKIWDGWKDAVVDTLVFILFLIFSFVPFGIYALYASQGFGL